MNNSLIGIDRILQLPTIHEAINTLWRELPRAVNEEGELTPTEDLFLCMRNFLSSIYCEGFKGAFFNAFLGSYESQVIEAYQGIIECEMMKDLLSSQKQCPSSEMGHLMKKPTRSWNIGLV